MMTDATAPEQVSEHAKKAESAFQFVAEEVVFETPIPICRRTMKYQFTIGPRR